MPLVVRVGEGRIASEFARKEAFLQRRANEDRQTPLPQPVDPQQKRIGIEQTEGQLHAVEVHAVDDMVDITGRIDRGTDEAHLAGLLESVQLVVQVRVPRQPMQLIKVDRIGAEALELRLQCRGHALGLEGVLGRDDPTAATFAQKLP